PGTDRLAAAARLWRRLAEAMEWADDAALPATGAVAVGGFAFRPDRDPAPPWSGFPGLLLRIPELAVTRVRGRTFAIAATAGADGTAFAGASPELLVRRAGRVATSQPMAGSTARGRDDAEDERLAGELRASAKDRAEHDLVASYVVNRLRPFSNNVEAGPPE